jgi:hypothetical protein
MHNPIRIIPDCRFDKFGKRTIPVFWHAMGLSADVFTRTAVLPVSDRKMLTGTSRTE